MDRTLGSQPGSKLEPHGEILGPYVLLADIRRGERTTVHLARKQGERGSQQRLVALKRLNPPFARSPDWVKLLLDEARIAKELHHANVAGALDAGSEPGCYVVVDYVEGDNFESLLAHAGQERHARYVLPVVVDMLNGLHAVHTARGQQGEPLGIVHQAPHARHVVVGIDGTARIVDFSQARARGTLPSRQRKDRLRVACMAPEQALCPDAVDHRADLFIVGLLLWEALTGERLFAAESEEQTFHNLLHRRIPKPSGLGLRPPPCFDDIVMRALEREPSLRYASALSMARDLREVALNQALYAMPGELGQWVKAISGRELIERRCRAGGDLRSQRLPVYDGRASGFFQSHRVTDESPYRSRRIYGGSFSRIDLREFDVSDPDKTPVFGQRADGEVDDATAPSGFVPARPGARRDTGTPSPGAYSEVSTKKRVSQPEVSGAQATAFDDAATSNFPALEPRASARPRPAQRAQRPCSPGGSARAASDVPAETAPRRDSTPTSRFVPNDAVGSAGRAAARGKAAAPLEQASPPPGTESRSVRPPAFAVDSLTPPTTSAHTLPPPEAAPELRPRRTAFWVSTWTLSGLIAVAAFVGIRERVSAPRSTAGSPAVTPVEWGSQRSPMQALPGPQAPQADKTAKARAGAEPANDLDRAQEEPEDVKSAKASHEAEADTAPMRAKVPGGPEGAQGDDETGTLAKRSALTARRARRKFPRDGVAASGADKSQGDDGAASGPRRPAADGASGVSARRKETAPIPDNPY